MMPTLDNETTKRKKKKKKKKKKKEKLQVNIPSEHRCKNP